MRIFTLEYAYWEDYEYYQFQHDTKSKEDFKNDVDYLIKHYGEEYIEEECSWVGIPGWIRYVSIKLPELGYNKVEADVVSFSGSGIIRGERDYNDKNGNPIISQSDAMWKEYVGIELFSKAVSKNRQKEVDMGKKRHM